MWGRGTSMLVTLPLFPLCPGSAHHQLSPHDPQPGLTYSKGTATALLKKHDWPHRASPKAGFLSLAETKRKCPKRMRSRLVYCVPITRRSPGRSLSWSISPQERHGEARLTKALENVPHLWAHIRAPCAMGHKEEGPWGGWGGGSGSLGWLRRGAGTPRAGCRPPIACQRSDGTTLGALKSPQTKVFRIVRALSQSPVCLLFSVAFSSGHKALNQHSAEPGETKGLKHLIWTRVGVF